MKKKNNLPYWPAEESIQDCIRQLREAGLLDSEEELRARTIRAYRKKRAEILAEEAMLQLTT